MWLPTLKSTAKTKESREALWALHEKQEWFQWGSLAFCLRRDRLSPETLEHGLVLYKELILDLRKTPPLGLFLDLVALLLQGEQFSPRVLPTDGGAYHRLLLRIQNEFYFKLVLLPSFQRVRRLLLALSDERVETAGPTKISMQEQAVIYLLSQLFSHVSDLLLDPFRPHQLPRENKVELWQEPQNSQVLFEEGIEHPDWFFMYHQALVDGFVRLNEKELILPVWEQVLLHFDLLHNKLKRLRWQQMAEIADEIPRPKRLREWYRLRDEGYHQMKLSARSVVPEGGFSGISQRGQLESLVPSELVYWDEASELDTFTLRWVEKELLYYERDQEVSYTWLRRMQFYMDLDVGEIRYKSSVAPASGVAVLFGFLARLTSDLRQICPEDVLKIEYFLSPEEKWKAAAPVCQLFLGSVAEVGGSSSLTLVPRVRTLLIDTVPTKDDIRILIVTPTTWKKYVSSEEKLHYHLVLCVVPSKEQIPDEAWSSVAGQSARMTEDTEELQPLTPSSQNGSNGKRLRGEGFEPIFKQIGLDLVFVLEQPHSIWKPLEQLRDALLKWILRVFPLKDKSNISIEKGIFYE